MFARILVPLDGTSEAACALPLARTLAELGGAQLLLLRVYDPADHWDADAARQATADAGWYLQRVVQELAGDGLSISTHVALAQGSPGQTIAAAAEDRDADLVVMATHGRGGLSRAVVGSVSADVLARSRVPVALVRPGGHRVSHVRHLLLPVDGTPGSLLALATAIPLARAASATLHLLQVVEPLPASLYAGLPRRLYADTIDPAWDAEVLGSARQYMTGLAEHVRRAGIQADGAALLGPTVPTIAEVADEHDADLVVMSTHGYTGLTRAFLGSVADAVVRTAQRPVLLVRRRDGDTPTDYTALDHAPVQQPTA